MWIKKKKHDAITSEFLFIKDILSSPSDGK